MSKIKRSIPNAITCGNLLCGCLAIVKAFNGDLVWAAYLVGIAAVLDFFDGFAARMLKVSSPIGKDLDSLADMVTFGVVPGVVMFQLLNYSVGNFNKQSDVFFPSWETDYLPYVAFIITIFSALRLAKFNNDTRQSESFVGVPTPANSILICSLPLILYFSCMVSENPISDFRGSRGCFSSAWDWESQMQYVILNRYFLISLTLLMSFLLVAELPLFALKFKHFKWKGNEIRFIFLLLAVLMFVFLKFVGIPLVIVLYVLLSVVNNLFLKKKETSSSEK